MICRLRGRCRSGLVSRKGCEAPPSFDALSLKSRGCFAALSRHKAAPTERLRLSAAFQASGNTTSPPPATDCPAGRPSVP
ncbi:hypothetical protein DMX06_20970 [Pseudomonas mosselii]|nr:hypothetical protein DMX06_20970 [Pseudomonas mosselii]